jgi:hypothetical protein
MSIGRPQLLLPLSTRGEAGMTRRGIAVSSG